MAGLEDLGSAEAAAAAVQKRPVRIILADHDGCFNGDRTAVHEYLRTGPFAVRPEEQIILGIGSNRQDWFTDYDQRSGPCTSNYPKFAEDLREELRREDLEFDSVLMADLYNAKDPGTAFEKMVNHPKIQDPDLGEIYNRTHQPDQPHQAWLFDGTKITLLYAMCQYHADKHRDSPIIIDFFDDCEGDILNPLFEFFRAFSDLLPHNVTLRLHTYACPVKSEPVATPPLLKDRVIKGQGIIDPDLRENLIALGILMYNNPKMNSPVKTREVLVDQLAHYDPNSVASDKLEMIHRDYKPDQSYLHDFVGRQFRTHRQEKDRRSPEDRERDDQMHQSQDRYLARFHSRINELRNVAQRQTVIMSNQNRRIMNLRFMLILAAFAIGVAIALIATGVAAPIGLGIVATVGYFAATAVGVGVTVGGGALVAGGAFAGRHKIANAFIAVGKTLNTCCQKIANALRRSKRKSKSVQVRTQPNSQAEAAPAPQPEQENLEPIPGAPVREDKQTDFEDLALGSSSANDPRSYNTARVFSHSQETGETSHNPLPHYPSPDLF